jgi:hypothetical protein
MDKALEAIKMRADLVRGESMGESPKKGADGDSRVRQTIG